MKYYELIVWTHNPTTLEDLKSILDSIPDADLMKCASFGSPKAAARIAWAEFAKRRGLFDFEISVTRTETQLVLDLVASDTAASDSVKLDIDIH